MYYLIGLWCVVVIGTGFYIVFKEVDKQNEDY